MRIFVYKVIIFFLAIFFLYHFTIGYTLYGIQKNFYSSLDKESVEKIKNKIRKELESAVKKDRILDDKDAVLLNNIMNKIKLEIRNIK
tara:strand:- start:107 stop:370 length:264 start_codon:yes stop_codon:yes gene_type:complete